MTDLQLPTLAEYNLLRANQFTEKQFQDVIIAAAGRYGWLVYHTHDSRRSQAGYPDLHLVHSRRGLSLFRELKTQAGKVAPAQQAWLNALKATGCDADVWRPIQWMDKTIPDLLFGYTNPT